MFETIKTVREAFDVPSSAFILISGFLGFVLFAMGGWIVDRVYQKGTHPPATQAAAMVPTPPSIAIGETPLNQGEFPKKSATDSAKPPRGREGFRQHNNTVHQVSTGPNSPNLSIEQRTEGANSPIVNSPITVNPEVNAYAPVTIYDFRGNKKVIADGGTNVKAYFADQEQNFKEMIELQNSKNWAGLRDFCEKQIKTTPNG